MGEATFHKETREVGNPFQAWGFARLGLGVLAIAAAGWTLVDVQSIVRDALAGGTVEAPAYVAGSAIVGVLALGWIVWGVRAAIQGGRRIGSLVVPPNAPTEIGEETRKGPIGRAREAFDKGTLPAYAEPPEILRRAWTERVHWMTPGPRQVAIRQLSRLTTYAFWLVLGLVGVAVWATLPSDLALAAYLDAIVGLPLAVPIATMLLLGGATYYVTARLVPDADPLANKLESVKTVKGGGDPFSLPGDIEQTLEQARRRDIPNRSIRAGWRGSQGGGSRTPAHSRERCWSRHSPSSGARATPTAPAC